MKGEILKRNYKALITVVIVVLILVGLYFIFNNTTKKQNENIKVSGEIKDVALSAKVITLVDTVNNEWNIACNDKTKIISENNEEIDLYSLIPQFEIEVTGEKADSITPNSIIASQVKVIVSKDLVIIIPKDGESLTDTKIRVGGYAKTSEGVINYKINDVEKGFIELPEGAGNYSYFDKEIDFSNLDLSGDMEKNISLSFYEKSLKDGSEINKVTISLKLVPKKILLYFSNIKLDPNMEDCTKVYPVEREVHILTNPIDVMHLLLQGPTEEEKAEGYISQIPKEAKINEIDISEGIAKIDFSNLNPGGSCRIAAIRAQITQTLKQFSEVKDVIISVDGNVEEALQP